MDNLLRYFHLDPLCWWLRIFLWLRATSLNLFLYRVAKGMMLLYTEPLAIYMGLSNCRLYDLNPSLPMRMSLLMFSAYCLRSMPTHVLHHPREGENWDLTPQPTNSTHSNLRARRWILNQCVQVDWVWLLVLDLIMVLWGRIYCPALHERLELVSLTREIARLENNVKIILIIIFR